MYLEFQKIVAIITDTPTFDSNPVLLCRPLIDHPQISWIPFSQNDYTLHNYDTNIPLTPNVTLMSQIFALRVYRMLHKCYTRIRVGVHRACQPVHSYLQHDLTVIVQYIDKRRVLHCLLRSWSIGGGPVAAAVSQSLVEVPLTDHTDITPPQGHYYGTQSEIWRGRVDGHAQWRR